MRAPLSLRARLLTGVVLLAAVSLAVLGWVIYDQQRRFLTERVDDQVAAAVPTASRALEEQGILPAGVSAQVPPFGRGRFGGGDGDGRGPGGKFGPPPGVATAPPGTFAQRRTASGTSLGSVVLLEDADDDLPAPKLPASLETGETTTVDAERGGLRYRVVAQPDRFGGTVVVAVPLAGVDDQLDRLLLVELLVIGGALVLIAVLGVYVVRLGLRPLDRMGETAGAIAAGDLSRRVEPATDRTEVGRLGLALNAMLGQIEEGVAQTRASEERLRQFLADASHELRTPLASIRGYAELFRMGAAREGAEAEKAMDRIEQESARMGVLVEDLLALARLDEVRENEHRPVDLATLVRDAAGDARATAPDREVALDVPAGPVVVAGDADQLRQVLGNFVRNALVHTPAGTPLELGVAVEPDGRHATLAVRDHGPGLPVDDGAKLFERFWRAEAGRGRGKAGAGLGLAIVQAIVDAHHGTVDARDAEGGGARFSATLPLDGQAA